MTASNSSSLMLKIIRSRRNPALFTRMSSPPKVSIAVRTMSAASSQPVTSPEWATAFPPAAVISSTTASAALSSTSPWSVRPRSFTTTCAPARASSSASARPEPPARAGDDRDLAVHPSTPPFRKLEYVLIAWPTQRVAFVTGASRGIGKQSAIALARAGLDVVITARTVHEGEGVDDSDGAGRPLPGSLETTAAEIESAGRRALPVPLDLHDRPTIGAAVEARARRVGSHRRAREQRSRHRARQHGPFRRHAGRGDRGQARRQRRRPGRDDQGRAARDARAGRRHRREHHFGGRDHRSSGAGRRGRLGIGVRDVEGGVPPARRRSWRSSTETGGCDSSTSSPGSW